MHALHVEIFIPLFAALVAGGMIGLERSFQGRPAGFRTHALVCMASSLLMQLTVFQLEMLASIPIDVMRIDPTRMAQGIMTGIGFLGAGVIMKDRITIRGLTTAASIWMTAAIGVLVGVGFYFAAGMATVLTIGALSLFRWFEAVMPSRHYARLEIRARNANRFTLDELNMIITRHDCSATNPGFALQRDGETFHYEMTLRTQHRENFYRLAESLSAIDKTEEFRIDPASE